MKKSEVILFAVALAIARPFIHTATPITLADAYKDLAHLFIGGLLVAMLMNRAACEELRTLRPVFHSARHDCDMLGAIRVHRRRNHWQCAMFWALCAWEVFCAFGARHIWN